MSKKKILTVAKMLFRGSLSGNYLDGAKVTKILKDISSAKITGKRAILKIYKRFIEAQIAKEEIIVEMPTAFKTSSSFERQLLAKTGAKKIKYIQKPDIVVGARVLVGDWVYDSTLDTKLKRLTIND